MLEGDDYWTSADKLSKQVSFLEENPTYSLCFHPIQVLENDQLTDVDRFTRVVPETTNIYDLALGNYMHTCSVVYRRTCLDNLPQSLQNSTVGDYFLHMLAARHGPIARLSETMAVYRVHEGGVWSAHRGLEDKILTYLECMIGHFDDDVDELLIKRHKNVAAKNFFNNLYTSDAADRLHRALRYGTESLLTELRLKLPKVRPNLLRRMLNRLKLSK